MKTKIKFLLLSLVTAILILSTSPLVSAEGDTTADAPPMDPVLAAKMQVLMTPNEAHKVLEAFAGKWAYTGKFWMSPEAPAQEMTGVTENAMDMGGRFLKQTITGPWMGQIFHGLGYTGYDNVKQEYVSVWLDDMGTGIMMVSGQYDAATKTLTQSGANSCPLTGEKARPGRSTWAVNDTDRNTYTSYTLGPDGKEFKSMEIVYARQ